MAALVLRIRAASIGGWFRAVPEHRTRRIVFAALLTIATALLCQRVLVLADGDPAAATSGMVLAGTACLLCFAFVPALVAASDPVAPRAFRTLGIAQGPVFASLLLASLVSGPTAMLIAFDASCAAVWIRLEAPVGIAVAAAAAHVLTCAIAARIAMALRSAAGNVTAVEPSRVVIAALLVLSVPVAVVSAELPTSADAGAALVRVSGALADTPFGAWSALPGSPSDGVVWTVGAATLLVVACGWWLCVRRALTTPDRAAGSPGARGLGWLGLMPATATGAIAARSLVYWLRDGRYLANALVIPIGCVLPVIPLLVAGVPFPIAILLPVPLMALFYGWLPHNDLAYDSSALWLHIATGVRGIADRLGRLAPVIAISVPTLAIALGLSVLLADRLDALPAMIGLVCSLLLGGLGLSSIASVVAPYAVSRPGDSAFRQPQRSESVGVWSQGLVLLGSVVLSIPALWSTLAALTGSGDLLLPLWIGIGSGVVVLAAGVLVGSVVFARRGSRLMEFASSS